jgi:acylphosphatase
MSSRRVELRVYGIVQGVFFRASTRDEAARLGLGGWVRNRPDGSVEVLAEGDEPALRRLVAFCREGPPGARVERVEEQWGGGTGEFDHFRVSY